MVSLSKTIVNSGEVLAGSDAGLSAMSVEDALSDDSDAVENSIVEADDQDDDSDDAGELSEASDDSESVAELTDTDAEQDAGVGASLPDDSEPESDDSDEEPGLTSLQSGQG